MYYHTLFFRKLGKLLPNLSSAAVVIGALRVKACTKDTILKVLEVLGEAPSLGYVESTCH